jgi:hypothetical protein
MNDLVDSIAKVRIESPSNDNSSVAMNDDITLTNVTSTIVIGGHHHDTIHITSSGFVGVCGDYCNGASPSLNFTHTCSPVTGHPFIVW